MRALGGKLSVSAPDHYYPFLFLLGISHEHDSLKTKKIGLIREPMELQALHSA
jgi:hypothetical protein